MGGECHQGTSPGINAGALGSFMLRSPEDPTEILTVAKWDSVENWKALTVRLRLHSMGAHAASVMSANHNGGTDEID